MELWGNKKGTKKAEAEEAELGLQRTQQWYIGPEKTGQTQEKFGPLRTLRRVVSNRPEENDPWQSDKDPEGFPGLGIKQGSKEMGEGRTVCTLDFGKSVTQAFRNSWVFFQAKYRWIWSKPRIMKALDGSRESCPHGIIAWRSWWTQSHCLVLLSLLVLLSPASQFKNQVKASCSKATPCSQLFLSLFNWYNIQLFPLSPKIFPNLKA